MMKILYLIGPEFTVFSLAYPHLEYLEKKQNKVLVLSEKLNRQIDLNVCHKAIPFSRKKISFRDLSAILKIRESIISFKPRVVYLSTPKMSLLGAIACLLTKTKYVYIHRGAYYQNYNNIVKFLFKKIDQFVINNSLRTNFISESLFHYVDNQLEVNRNKIFKPKYNSSKGVDTFKFKPSLIRNSRIRIIHCGRICEDKGFYDLLELIKNFANDERIYITIIGRLEINSNQIKEFLKVISKSDNVKFIKWTDKLFHYMNNSDIHFFPSMREGFGNVAIEAASSGVVTIAKDIPGVKDAVKNFESGFLVNSGGEMIEKTQYLINNIDILDKMKTLARDFALQEFDPQKVIPEILRTR